jgi:glycosyltransferase involved in cell wall biosynthesis
MSALNLCSGKGVPDGRPKVEHMIIALDARPLARRHDGISRFAWELVEHLCVMPGVRLVLLSNRPVLNTVLPESVEVIVDQAWARVPGTLWFAFRFPFLARQHAATVIWGTQHVLPPFLLGIPGLLTMHDVVFKRYPETMRWDNRLANTILVGRSLNLASRVVCVSQFTADEVKAFFPSIDMTKLVTVHHGMTYLPEEEVMPEPLPERFFFTLGSVEPRKNLTQVIHAFSLLTEEYQDLRLVIAGGAEWKSSALHNLINELKISERVLFTGRVTDGQIRYCLKRSAACVYASKYEGFGLPALEASGVAPWVILNDIPVLREIGRYVENPLYVDFASAKNVAAVMRQALRGEIDVESGAVSRSWGDAAQDYRNLFMAICA